MVSHTPMSSSSVQARKAALTGAIPYKDRSGVMSGSNEAIAHLQEKLEQARRLLQQVSDPTTTVATSSSFIANSTA
jgi:hypothetical protein